MSDQLFRQIGNVLENYDIKFSDEIPDRLKCIICKKILNNPNQTICGCKACEKCIDQYLKDGEKPCPNNCSESQLRLKENIYPDNASNKEIANLNVQCPFSNCTEATQSLRLMVSHIDKCDHRDVTCAQCGKKYCYQEKTIHDQNQCDARIVKCPHCVKEMYALTLEKEHLNWDHYDICSKYIHDCPYGCEMKAVNLKDHSKECPKRTLSCPFSDLKCKSDKMTMVKLTDHLHNESISHSDSIVTELVTLINSNKLIKEEITILNENAKKDSIKISNLSEKCQVLLSGIFIWKIENFQKVVDDARQSSQINNCKYLNSDPFYTHEFGYKMCLRIYPCGDRTDSNEYISVFMVLMKGDYDDTLSWPFKLNFTISLLDLNNNGKNNIVKTFKTKSDNSGCYQKPVTQYNNASGTPTFIELIKILPDSNYYKSDTVFLKIFMDTSVLLKPHSFLYRLLL